MARRVRGRLVSWNVAGKVRRLGDQAAWLAALEAGVVCLQEVRASSLEGWTEALAAAGLGHVRSAPLPPPGDANRRLAVLTASRAPIDDVLEVPGVPWPERVLSVVVDGAELVNVHSPISPKPDLVKVRTHEAVHRHLAAPAGRPRLVCGDWNTPRREHPDGRVWTFARTSHGKLRPERGERWDTAELALVKGLEPHGYRDAFRTLHGLEVKELSWEWPRWGGGYRLDHLVVSDAVEVLRCEYHHDGRKAGLSDHSALLADLEWVA